MGRSSHNTIKGPCGTLSGSKERQGASESHAAPLSRAFWGLPKCIMRPGPDLLQMQEYQ